MVVWIVNFVKKAVLTIHTISFYFVAKLTSAPPPLHLGNCLISELSTMLK